MIAIWLCSDIYKTIYFIKHVLSILARLNLFNSLRLESFKPSQTLLLVYKCGFIVKSNRCMSKNNDNDDKPVFNIKFLKDLIYVLKDYIMTIITKFTSNRYGRTPMEIKALQKYVKIAPDLSRPCRGIQWLFECISPPRLMSP